MNKLSIDIIEFIAKSNILVYHLLINSVPRLIRKQGLHKRAVDNFTIKDVNINGNVFWFLNGVLHREDGPAVMWLNGYTAWCLNGKLHRVDGPALIDPNGDVVWYLNGELHRVDGPALITSNGKEEYWLNGVKQKNNKRKRV